MRAAVRTDQLGRKAVQVRLVAGRDLQGGRFHLDEAFRLEEAPERCDDAIARQQEGAAVGMHVRLPPKRQFSVALHCIRPTKPCISALMDILGAGRAIRRPPPCEP